MKLAELMAMTDCQVNKTFSIRGTTFDRNVRYSPRIKQMMKNLYESGSTIQEIMDTFGANRETVKKAVVPGFAEKCKEQHSKRSAKYRATHTKKKVIQEDKERGAYKKTILSLTPHLVEI